MLLSRADLTRATGATELELSKFERERLIVPVRTWRTLWLSPRYTFDHLRVVEWLVKCRRSALSLARREIELLS